MENAQSDRVTPPVRVAELSLQDFPTRSNFGFREQGRNTEGIPSSVAHISEHPPLSIVNNVDTPPPNQINEIISYFIYGKGPRPTVRLMYRPSWVQPCVFTVPIPFDTELKTKGPYSSKGSLQINCRLERTKEAYCGERMFNTLEFCDEYRCQAVKSQKFFDLPIEKKGFIPRRLFRARANNFHSQLLSEEEYQKRLKKNASNQSVLSREAQEGLQPIPRPPTEGWFDQISEEQEGTRTSKKSRVA